MRRAHEIIVAPLITEKSTLLKEKRGTLAFRVDRRANKVEIRRAVETLFKVKVAAVRTENVRGKDKRVGRFTGRRPDWKKAYVTLKPGEKPIEYFEAV
ncbi:MAG TPA: 50S ribosomal protein L23 [Candidatus Polarisedimenticolia bacterium]|nr:50S ribosomal protein L23 [Candidatus Polarisedimenticolia bacterium]